MTTRDDIAAKLDDFAFHKANFGGFLMNKRAKASHTLWASAPEKGVTELAILATRDYGSDNVYDVAAFVPGGTISEEDRAAIAPRAEQLADDINLREHGYVYTSLEPWDGAGTGGWIAGKPQFRELSILERGVHVIPIQRLSGLGDPRWLAWTRAADGTLSIAIVYKP